MIPTKCRCQNLVGRHGVLGSEAGYRISSNPHSWASGTAGGAIGVGGAGCQWEELSGLCCQDWGRLVLPLAPGS